MAKWPFLWLATLALGLLSHDQEIGKVNAGHECGGHSDSPTLWASSELRLFQESSGNTVLQGWKRIEETTRKVEARVDLMVDVRPA